MVLNIVLIYLLKGMKKHYTRISMKGVITLKNSSVDPPALNPYLIFDCFIKSSAEAMGMLSRSIVKKAARLAV
jgi:hypothetical protein